MNHKPNIYQANTCPPCPPNASLGNKIIYWLGIGLGSGKPKRAAGTWGTLGGLLIALPMLWLGFEVLLVATLLGLAAGAHICGKTSRLMGVHDDPHIVWDEWVGIWLALLPVAWWAKDLANPYADGQVWLGILLSFGLFRLFDVLKPFPISWADKQVSGGFGILLDDVLAGWMAAILVMAVLMVWVK